MEPANVKMTLRKTATLQDKFRVMQPSFTYKVIAAIEATAPVKLHVVGHGLQPDWLAWIQSSNDLPGLNRDPRHEQPHRITVLGDDHVEINAISAIGSRPSGGILIYKAPIDFTGAAASWKVYDKMGGTLVFELDTESKGGLVFTSPGVITRNTSLLHNALLNFTDGWHTLDITFPNGRVDRFLEGVVNVLP